MFRWANKESLEHRSSSKNKVNSLHTENSCPSSPGHSNATLDSRAHQSRKKIILTSKKKGRDPVPALSAELTGNASNKIDLLRLMEERKNKQGSGSQASEARGLQNCPMSDCSKILFRSPKRGEKTDERSSKYSQGWSGVKKSTIRIIRPHNELLGEFMRSYREVHLKVWNTFAMAHILLEMGFIRDLVHDRELVRRIWSELYSPDPLAVYAFVEKTMGNRVSILEAAEALEARNTEFIEMWVKTIEHSHELTQAMDQLKNNRKGRRRQHNAS